MFQTASRKTLKLDVPVMRVMAVGIYFVTLWKGNSNQLPPWATCYTRALLKSACPYCSAPPNSRELSSLEVLWLALDSSPSLLSSSLFPTVLELRLRTLCTLGKDTAAELHPQPQIHIFKEWLLKPEVYSAWQGFYNSNGIKYSVFWTRQSGVHTAALKYQMKVTTGHCSRWTF